MALYWLDLSYMSRSVFPAGSIGQPGRMRQHGNYILRESARDEILTVGMPANKHAIKRFLHAYELVNKPDRTPEEERLLFHGNGRSKPLIDTLPEGYRTPMRVNGRWHYKVMHALPVELSRKGQIEATRQFIWSLTMRGRGIAVASFHDLDTHNPHVHIMFFDRDIETGKSVAFLSHKPRERAQKGLEPDSTKWVRKLWEIDCNAIMAAEGLEERIDCRSNLERGIDQAAGEHRGWKAEEILVPEMASAEGCEQAFTDTDVEDQILPEELPPEAPLEDMEEAPDEDIPEDLEDYPMALPVSQRFRSALSEMREMRILADKRTEAIKLQRDYAYWREEAEKAREKAELAHNALEDSRVRTETAEVHYQKTHLFGFRKFWRKDKAIQAEAELAKAQYAEARHGADFREANNHANRATQKVWQLEQKVASIEDAISLHERINGQIEEYDDAESYMKEQLEKNLQGLSANDVMDSYNEGDLSEEQAQSLFVHMGHPELAAFIETEKLGPSH